ncbi:cell death-inducing p53-target protein 1-like [Bolinopsis microptera]|uniref:cell death-inducing p53-target protein 1-like n=1 Tax=Bolinopsis microptera TaxID=2820187 RepID=UPI00307A47A1
MGKDQEAPPTYEEAVQPGSEPHSGAALPHPAALHTAPPPSYVPVEGYPAPPESYQPGGYSGYTTTAGYPAQPYPAQPYPVQVQLYPSQQYPGSCHPVQLHSAYNATPSVTVVGAQIRRGPDYSDSTSDLRNVGILSMITCLFCCCPFGTIALYKVYQSNEYAKIGDRQLADISLHSARKWALLGIIIGIATYIMWSVRNMLG